MLISKLIKNKKIFFKIMIVSIFSYLTFWILLLNLGYYIGALKNYQYSVLLLTLLMSISGFILTYIHPKKFIVPIINYKLNHNECKVMDIIFHHIPLLILLIVYDNEIKKDNLLLFFITIFTYLLINDPIKLYHI